MIKYTSEQADLCDLVVQNDGIVLVKAGAGCVDKDTEFLTPSGWKTIDSYNKNDLVAQWNTDGSITFIAPNNYIKIKADTLNHIKSNTVDMVLSDEHRTPYITNKGNFKVKTFKELSSFGKLKIPRSYTSVTNSKGCELSDELIRVLVMQYADGSRVKNIKNYKIKICVKKQTKKLRVRKLLEQANIKYTMSKCAYGFDSYYYYPPKEIAFKSLSCLWSCNTEQLKIVGNEASYWDSSFSKRKNIASLSFTGNKADAELVQHAWHITTGCYVTICKDSRKHTNEDLYTVSTSSRKVSDLTFKSNRNRKLSTIESYKTLDGFKYCFTTESSFWLARRNGKVFPTGNSGKSFMAEQIVYELKPTSGIYTAFNKAIVEEGSVKFANTPIECKTFHALAYQYARPSRNIENFTYKTITEKVTYTEKRRIISTLDQFFVSSSDCMHEYFEKEFKEHPRCEFITGLCVKYVEAMANGDIPPTFNFMLKSLHLMLLEKTVKINVDLIILDEINDVTAVALEIFKLVNAPKKIGLGESHQAIYQFLNLVDGFEELKDQATTVHLTKSYRCSENIAKRINDKMCKVLDKDFKFVGTDKPVTNGMSLYCTLTNASIVGAIYDRLSQGKGFTLLRKPSDIFAAPLAVLSASQGKKPYQKQYEFLLDLYDEFKAQKKHKSYFKFLSEELDDQEINNAVRLLMKFSKEGVSLFNIYKETKQALVDKNYTISTVFTSKGLEFETVYIADDLNTRFTSACTGDLDDQEALTAKRCYYVACSRAGVNLLNSVI